jgi:glycosyltransferase involved in cell wall biosynthesis
VVSTVDGLRESGAEVEYLQWWDAKQSADLIHSFGVPDLTYIEFAATKGIPVVNTTLFTATCNRNLLQLSLQGAMVSTLLGIPPLPPWGNIRSQLIWSCFNACNLNIVGLEAEADVLKKVYGVPHSKIRIVPLGLQNTFLQAEHSARVTDELITTGTITERKRSIELAQLAISAKVPIRFVGKPYDANSQYWRDFSALIDDHYVRYTPHTESMDEMVGLLQHSRGYVLASDYENWCLSAHEAIACGLPILVPNQRWSRELFGNQAQYWLPGDFKKRAQSLKRFYNSCPTLPIPNIKLYSWVEVGEILIDCYKDLFTEKTVGF